MKAQKIITIITIIVLVIIISLASFIGIYIKDEYRVSNIVPDYKLGMEFTDRRVISLEVDKEANGDEILTIDNYKNTKSILKNRLKALGVDQYRLVLDETTGNIQIRIPENEDTDLVIYNLLQSGTFELKDGETKEILMDTNAVKSADVMYSQQETQTAVFLQIKFNKDAKQKLEEISKTYVETIIETTNEEGETEQTTETKTVELYLNEQLVREINLQDSIMDGMLYIGIGAGSDAATLEQYKVIAEETAGILNSGVLPITYIETDYIEVANVTEQQIKIATYVALGSLVLMVAIFIIGLKTKGILASILQIGYIGLLLLALRYTNVKITIQGICGIVLGVIINFVYIYKAFKNIDLNFVKDVTVKFALKLIPVYVISIILSFSKSANIYSLGMTLVWAVIVMYLYNLSLTKTVLKAIKE